jgi:hypothetical protein
MRTPFSCGDNRAAMRDDMYELIIERPRWGSRWLKYPRRAKRVDAKVTADRDPDSLPSKMGMQRGAKAARVYKSLNENLAPLRRYLESQVNRPWDKVWSEISANLQSGNTVQQHVRDHVRDFVAYNTFVRDGTIYLVGRSGGPYRLSDGGYRMYVDPRTGILRRNKHYKSWQGKRRDEATQAGRERAARMREIAPDTQLHKFEDRGWWEVKLAPMPIVRTPQPGTHRYYETYEPVTDVVLAAKLSDLPADELYGRHGVYAVAKRQLSRKEIAALDLCEPTAPIPQRSR